MTNLKNLARLWDLAIVRERAKPGVRFKKL